MAKNLKKISKKETTSSPKETPSVKKKGSTKKAKK